jgi:hypothetical protein
MFFYRHRLFRCHGVPLKKRKCALALNDVLFLVRHLACRRCYLKHYERQHLPRL